MASGLRHIATEPGNLNHRSEVPSSGTGSGNAMSGLSTDGSVPNAAGHVTNSHGHIHLKRSPLLRNKKKSVAGTASDSVSLQTYIQIVKNCVLAFLALIFLLLLW